MPPKHRGGGCACCGPPPCELFYDDFNRDDSDSLGSDWTEVAGDWDIVSNRAASSTADSIVVSVATYTDAHFINCWVSGTAGGIIAYVSSDTYVYWRNLSDSMSLHEVISGSDTTLATVPWTAMPISLEVNICYKPARNGESAVITLQRNSPGRCSQVSMQGVGPMIRSQLSTPEFDSGGKIGFVSYSTPSSETVDWIGVYTIASRYEGGLDIENIGGCRCCECECDYCAEPDMPLELDMTIAGVANPADPWCDDDCDTINDTWTISCPTFTEHCQWLGSAPCGATNVEAILLIEPANYGWHTLLVRTDDDTGEINVNVSPHHRLEVNDIVDVSWYDGGVLKQRAGMTVTVNDGGGGDFEVTVDGGTGDVLPAAFSDVAITPQVRDYILKVHIYNGILDSGPNLTVIYEHNFGTSKPACWSWSGLSMTQVSLTADADACDFSSATMTISTG